MVRRSSEDWKALEGEVLFERKKLVTFSGFYKSPSGGGKKALFTWQCLRCEKVSGPSQYRDICRSDRTSCCSKSSKHGTRRWGYKYVTGAYMRSLTASCDKRKLDWDIDSEYLYHLMENQNHVCPYTGFHISLADKNASLDRIDSSNGYLRGNVQWVYAKVNQMKWDLPEIEFLELCKLIYTNNKEKIENDY